MEQFGNYIIITNPALPHTSIAEMCVARGVRMLQLREKYMSDRQLIAIAKDIRSITKSSQTRFVINDRPDIAVACHADYLHLGQDDMEIDDVRKIVGQMNVGLSTHSISQLQQALLLNPSYVGFGPIFPTNAKAIPDSPVGLDALREALAISTVPLVAIGGIFPNNIADVLGVGTQNFAMVRHFMQIASRKEFVKQLSLLQYQSG